MRILGFGANLGKRIEKHGSDFWMTRLIHTDSIQVGCMYLEAGGLVGYHEASTYQLFAVVRGEGWVWAGDAGRRPLRTSQAAFWSPGEYHEAGTDTGMVVMVIEGDALGDDPLAEPRA